MTSIRENYNKIVKGLKEGVTLVTVTKTRTPKEINEAIDAGATDIGENKVQEIMDKFDSVKKVNWHMIGHLQTNKVKYIIDKVKMIHSVDSYKLAKEIDKRAKAKDLTMDILIQINPALEESKFGVSLEETRDLINEIVKNLTNVRIKGLMAVAPFFEDSRDAGKYFADVKKQYDELSEMKDEKIDFEYLSMGMSNDYIVAMEEGSNMVRVGSAIFGERIY